MKLISSISCAFVLALSAFNVQAASIAAAERAINQNAFSEALEELRPLAETGDQEALYLLGTLYLDGKGVDKNVEQAQSFFGQAARQGHIPSVNAIRGIKNEAFKVEFDETLPRAEQGNSTAQNRIGEMYEFAQGVDRDPTAAFDWYQKAANQGYLSAIHNLARSHNFGTGTDVDFVKAEELFREAAALGYADSMFFLGTLYATQHGTEKQIEPDVQAYAWMQSAADRGSLTAQTIAGRFKMKLSDQQIASAESLVSEFRSKYVTPFQ